MYLLLDKCFLLLLSFLSIPITGYSTAFVIGFLFSIIEASYQYFFNKKHCTLIFITLYLIGSFKVPILLFFVPVMLYDVFVTTTFSRYLLSITYLLLSFFKLPTYGFFLCVLSTCFAIYSSYKSTIHNQLVEAFHNMEDESRYHNLLLKEKNNSLMEKQDYELYTAVLKERNRIAREIHDNVGHMLSRSILLMGAVKTINQSRQLDTPLEQLETTLVGAMNNVRQSVHDLHDESLDLKVVLESIVCDFSYCDITFDYDIQSTINRDIKYSFISIIKEALANIMKHSNATKVCLVLREHPSFLQLVIQDNGTNLPKSIDTLHTSGIGLINMEERIEQLQGTLKLQTHPGFRIFITVPFSRTKSRC